MADEKVLIRCLDGRANALTFRIPVSLFGWPLPSVLVMQSREDSFAVAPWVAGADYDPRECEVYYKVSESEVTDEEIGEMPNVERGAQYSIEPVKP